ncbi:hypothetical protein MRX96_004676 [Rhipicephalus microplus]
METKRCQVPGYDVYPVWDERAGHRDITGLEPGTEYSVQVAAVCQGGRHEYTQPPKEGPNAPCWQFRFTSSGSPSCAECPAEETTEHILLHCPGYTEQRRRLFDAYGRLGLPHVSLDHLRFPQAPRSSLMRAFEALLEFFGDAALIARL